MSRNEAPHIKCDICGKKPAVKLCTIHYAGEPQFFCTACGKKHAKTCPDFDDYSAFPVVNSPRMGVCGYIGKYMNYLVGLQLTGETERKLFMALPNQAWLRISEMPLLMASLETYQVKLIVFDAYKSEILSWIKPKSIKRSSFNI